MKYKVGDMVRIKSKAWYEANKDIYGSVSDGKGDFVYDMTKYCGQIATIQHVNSHSYDIDIDNDTWSWYDFCFEDTTMQPNTAYSLMQQAVEQLLKEKQLSASIAVLQLMQSIWGTESYD